MPTATLSQGNYCHLGRRAKASRSKYGPRELGELLSLLLISTCFHDDLAHECLYIMLPEDFPSKMQGKKVVNDFLNGIWSPLPLPQPTDKINRACLSVGMVFTLLEVISCLLNEILEGPSEMAQADGN